MHDRAREGRGGVSALLRYLYYPLSVTSSYDCVSYVVVVQQGFTFGALVVVALVDAQYLLLFTDFTVFRTFGLFLLKV